MNHRRCSVLASAEMTVLSQSGGLSAGQLKSRTAERSIGCAKESDNRNSRQELLEVCDQTHALQPRSTMPDDNNSHSRSQQINISCVRGTKNGDYRITLSLEDSFSLGQEAWRELDLQDRFQGNLRLSGVIFARDKYIILNVNSCSPAQPMPSRLLFEELSSSGTSS